MDKLICDKYATALFELAKEENKTRELEEEAALVVKELKANPDFEKLIGHPAIEGEEKTELITKAFEGLDTTLLAFVSLIIRRNRGDMLRDILTEYVELSRQERGLVRAEIVSPIPLNEERVGRLKAVLEKKTGKTVEPVVSVDPSLIGGLKITVLGVRINSTISGSLKELKDSLKAGVSEGRNAV